MSPGRRGTEFGNQTPVSALGFVGNSSPVMGMLCKLIHFTLTATLQMVTIFILQVKKLRLGISLAVQWLRLHVSNAGGSGSIPSQGTKIRHAVQCGQKVKRRKEKLRLKEMICPRPHYSIVREQVLRHFYLCSSIKPASLFELSKDGESVNSSSQMELIHIQGIFFFFFFSRPVISPVVSHLLAFPGGSVVKNPPANAGDVSWIPRSGRSPREGKGYTLQYSCLENSTDRGALQAIVHGVTKSQT